MTDRQVIERYFDLAADPDLEAYFSQFTDDVVIEDEGHTHTGIDAVRAWRTSVPPVTYEVRDVAPTDDGYRAVAEIAGDFPGSPVDLAFGFVLDDERVRGLTIRPAETDAE